MTLIEMVELDLSLPEGGRCRQIVDKLISEYNETDMELRRTRKANLELRAKLQDVINLMGEMVGHEQ